MASPSDNAKLSLMALPSMDDDGHSVASPTNSFTAVLTPGADSPNAPHAANESMLLTRPPRIHITLLSRKLITYVLSTCLFLAVFTGLAYRGFVVDRITQKSLTKAINEDVDARVELFNAISGFLIALIEVLLGVYMEHFLPAFNVYLHNTLWYLHTGVAATKMSRRVYAVLMFLFPVVLMLVIGQCLRSFQASQSSVGFKTIMLETDLSLDTSMVEVLKRDATTDDTSGTKGNANVTTTTTSTRLSLGPLQVAINGTSIPFQLKTDSVCNTQRQGLRIGLHDLDSANVVYGFPTREWYSEMLDERLNDTYRYSYSFADALNASEEQVALEMPDFDLNLAADMYASGKVLLDRLVAESTTEYTECGKSDDAGLQPLLEDAMLETDPEIRATLKCKGAFRTLVEVGNFHAASKVEQTPEELMAIIAISLGIAVDGMALKSPYVTFRKHDITSQVQMESMVVTARINLNKTGSPFFKSEKSDFYRYGKYAKDLCGPENCVFLDTNNALEIPKQVVLLPFQTGCKYTQEDVHYLPDVRAFAPGECETQPNAAIIVAITSYIRAENYASRSDSDPQSETPLLEQPARYLRMAMSKLTWQTEPLHERFDHVHCRTESQKCNGLAYRLTKTGRFVFVSDSALPNAAISSASLAVPIRLIQLNQARFYITNLLDAEGNQIAKQLTPERLHWQSASGVFEYWDWEKSLSKRECNSFMDSYLDHINRNNYFLERPFEIMYQAAMFYLFTNGSVTELNTTDIMAAAAVNRTSLADAQIEAQALANLKLKGDVQNRVIKVTVPKGTFLATLVGCCVLMFVALTVVIAPTRAMEYFPDDVTSADKFFALKNDETYPDLVHKKTLLFPASGETLPMEDFDVEEMTLVNREDPTDTIKFHDPFAC